MDADNSGLSAEIFNNGNFDSASNWTVPSEWEYDSSNKYMSYDASGNNGLKQLDSDLVTTIVAGASYTLTFTVSGGTARYWILNANQNQVYHSTANYTAGTHTITFTTPADVSGGGISFYAYGSSGGEAHNLDNVSLKETVQAYDSTDNNNHGSLI